MAMAEGRDGSLWSGADNGGALNRIKDGHVTTYGQDQGFVMSRSTATTALFEDDRRVLWIGSRELLQSWDGSHFTRFTTKDAFGNQKKNAICVAPGGWAWIGPGAGC